MEFLSSYTCSHLNPFPTLALALTLYSGLLRLHYLAFAAVYKMTWQRETWSACRPPASMINQPVRAPAEVAVPFPPTF